MTTISPKMANFIQTVNNKTMQMKSKSATLKQLETIIGKLSSLNYTIEGNQLQQAIREVAYVRDKLQSNQLTIRK